MSAKFPSGGSKPILSHPSNMFMVNTLPDHHLHDARLIKVKQIEVKFLEATHVTPKVL